ncbi:MAG: DMT family transporter, partial [Zoogloeaceae bacterium]|nr:DMT family transporter [Zoogloeaceae bacterium]
MMRLSAERAGITLALLAAVGFSMKAIFVKLAYGVAPVDAITIMALRMLFSVPVFLFVALRQQQRAPALSRRDWGMLILLGIIGYYGSSLLDFMGLRYISAALERLILYTYPTLTVLIAWIWFKRPLKPHEWIAIALSYAGIGFAFAHDLDLAAEGSAVWLGGGLVFASSLAYALYLTGGAPMIARMGGARFTALAMTVSAIGAFLHFALTETPAVLVTLHWKIYAFCGLMAVFSTVLPVFMLSAAIQRIGAPRTVLIG